MKIFIVFSVSFVILICLILILLLVRGIKISITVIHQQYKNEEKKEPLIGRPTEKEMEPYIPDNEL